MKGSIREIAKSVGLLAVLGAVFWIMTAQRSRDSSAQFSSRAMDAALPVDEADVRHIPGDHLIFPSQDDVLADVRLLPSYMDVEKSLRQLCEARQQLLRRSADNATSKEALATAAADYRRMLDICRAHCDKLRSRVTEDQWSRCLHDFVFMSVGRSDPGYDLLAELDL